jgi:hypothetical protein
MHRPTLIKTLVEDRQQTTCICSKLSLDGAYVSCNNNNNNSISRGAEYVNLLAKRLFLISKFSFFSFFFNTTNKTKTWTAIGGRLLIASQLDESLCLTNQKLGAAVRSITYQPGDAKYVTLAKTYFSHPSLVFPFCRPHP